MKKLVALSLICGLALSSEMTVNAAGLKDVFNAEYYADQYPDLLAAFGYDEELLYKHFLEYGLKEGRVMNPVIDIVKYRNSYEDLDNAFGDNWDAYVQHYIEYGIEEKRDNGTDFDPIMYVESYADIEAAFGDDFSAIIDHYQTYGMKEERQEASKVYQEEKKQEAAVQKPVVAPPVVTPPAEEEYPIYRDENGNIYDLGGMEIIVRNWWGSTTADPNSEYEMARQEYLDWAEETYNFTLKEMAISDWGSAPQDFVDYVVSGGDDNNYIFTLRNDPTTISALQNGLMYDLSTVDCLDFSEDKFQTNKLHQQYSVDGGVFAMDTGYAEPRTGIFFNKTILEEAGVDPDSIYDMQANGTWTWDAWTSIMDKVQRDIDGDGTIDVYGFDANYGLPVYSAVYSNNAQFVGMVNGDYTYEFESAATVEALQWINDTMAEYTVVRPADAQWDYYKESFAESQCAFVVDDFYNAGPYYYVAELGEDVGFVMFPKGPQATDYTNCWSGNPLVIPACYDAEKAWKLAFAYDIYTADIIGYEDYYSWNKDSYCFDDRAENETVPMMITKGTIEYHSMVLGLDMNAPFIWKFNRQPMNVVDLLASVRDDYKACIDAAN